MKTKSAKAKGRLACTEVRDLIFKWFPELTPDDVRVTTAGCAGEDLLLSPKARSLLPVSFEVKNQESIQIWKALAQAHDNAGNYHPVVAFRRNRSKLHVALELETFLNLVRRASVPVCIETLGNISYDLNAQVHQDKRILPLGSCT